MAIIRGGLCGTISGRVGDLVYSNRKGVNYVKRAPKKTKKEPSAKQLAARERLRSVIQFLVPLKEVIERGYSNRRARHASALNMAVSDNYGALSGTEQHPEPDYSKIVLSQGVTLPRPMGGKIAVGDPGHVQVSWRSCKMSEKYSYDRATIVITCPEKEQAIVSMDEFVRQDQVANLEIPSDWLNTTVYGYIFMSDSFGGHSCTEFAGSLVL